MKSDGWLAMAVLLLSWMTGAAQERRPQDITIPAFPENGFEREFRLPDSLGIRTTERWEWEEKAEDVDGVSVRSAVPMTSVVVVRQEYLPVRTMVLRNNTLRIGRYIIISNGQAENWGPYPDGYLDARTISLPDP